MDWFEFLWTALVAFAAYWQFQWWREGNRTGVATVYFHYKFSREEKPFEYKMIQSMRLVGLVVIVAMTFFGLQFWKQIS